MSQISPQLGCQPKITHRRLLVLFLLLSGACDALHTRHQISATLKRPKKTLGLSTSRDLLRRKII